jgi:hypothetical protein
MDGRHLIPIVAGVLFAGTTALADRAVPKEGSSFGALKSPDPVEVRKQAEVWLKSVGGQADGAAMKTIWEADHPLLDKVSRTLALGDEAAGRLLAGARDPHAPAPTAVPMLLKSPRTSVFFRANLTLAYAKALTLHKVYEEALESFVLIKPEDVVDPAAYCFHKAVCEYALMLKDRADASIDRLLVDVADAPERYRTVAALMHFDMLTWQEKDLGWIARKMDNIQRRLDLKRGGKSTQKMQKEVLVRLDEMIKEIENKQKQQQSSGEDAGNDGNCPPGGQQPGQDSSGTDRSAAPARDTIPASANGKGEVDAKKVKEIAAVWGKLPEKERAGALRELTRTMPVKDRAVIEAYFKELQKKSSRK